MLMSLMSYHLSASKDLWRSGSVEYYRHPFIIFAWYCEKVVSDQEEFRLKWSKGERKWEGGGREEERKTMSISTAT